MKRRNISMGFIYNNYVKAIHTIEYLQNKMRKIYLL